MKKPLHPLGRVARLAPLGFVGILACVPAPETEPRSPSDESEKFSGTLLEDLRAGDTRDVLVLLDEQPIQDEIAANEALFATAGPSALLEYRAARYRELGDSVRAVLPADGAAEGVEYDHFPMLALTLSTPEALELLAAQPSVLQVYEDLPHEHFLTQSLAQIGQPSVAAAGKTGAGTTVAVLDTGADFTLPAFGSCASAGAPGCAVVVAQDFATNDNLRDDNTRHGTNVSAIVLGVAPGAKIAALDVFRSDGLAYSSDIIAALNWAIQNKDVYNIAAVNMSLGGGSATAVCSNDAFATPVANVRAAGITPVIASGNNGFTNAMSSPACVPAAVSVGAVYDANMGSIGWSACSDATTAVDRVTCFSNSTSFLSLLAPGALITAAGITMGGTSQATPHVAGAVAVLKAVFPEKTPDQLVTLLQDTGVSITDHRNGIVKKRIDLAAAASDCVTSVSPTSLSVGSSGGAASVTITAPAGCAWTASSNAAFASVTSGASGTGNGTVSLSVSANSGSARAAVITVARRAVSLAQESGLDTTGPTGSISINNGAEYTTNAAVTLTLSASDPSGLATMCITTGTSCSSFVAYATSKSFTLPSGSGSKTVRAFFKDSVGNVSAAVSDSIIFDNTKPTDGSAAAVGGNTQVSLSWSGFSDAHSGLASYKVMQGTTAAPTSCTTGTQVFAGTGTSFVHTGRTNGTTYFYRICALDNAGNLSTGTVASARAASEFVAPTGSVVINSGAAFTQSTSVTLTVTGNDASGVAKMCVAATTVCTAFVTFEATKTFTLPAGTGVKTVYVVLQDSQGNNSSTAITDTITLDATAPVNGTVTAIGGNAQVSLSWSGFSDAHSGLASYKVMQGTTAAPTSCTTGTQVFAGTGTSFVHTGRTNGTTYFYRICALDNAGNLSTGTVASARAASEFVAPTGSVLINSGAAFTGSTSVTLTVTGNDASGVAKMCITASTTCTTFVAFAGTKTFTLPTGTGLKTVRVLLEDSQGNRSTDAITDTITLDATKPVDGSVAATPGAGQTALSWSGFSDAHSGLASYKVVFATGTTTPPSCASGTVLFSGTGTNTAHTGQTSGLRYNYRICAIDAVGNVSVGKTISSTP